MGVSILYPKYMKKWVPNLPANSSRNEFFLSATYFFDFGIGFYIQNGAISTLDRSKSSVERPKQAKSVILLDFSRIFSTQISSGMARTYTRPIPALPGHHPSL